MAVGESSLGGVYETKLAMANRRLVEPHADPTASPKPKTKEISRLLHLDSDIQIPPSLALSASEKEMIVFSEMVSEALKETRSVILEPEKFQQAAENINRIENECDERQRDITVYLTRTQRGTLTNQESIQSQSLIRVADEMSFLMCRWICCCGCCCCGDVCARFFVGSCVLAKTRESSAATS